MKQQLWVRFNSDDGERIDFSVIDASGAVMHAETNHSLTALRDWLSQNKFEGRCCVVVPSRALTTVQTHIASRHKKQLTQALPFAVEDFIAEPVATMHLPYVVAGDNQQWVFATTKDQMRCWLDGLQQIGVQPDYVIPDFMTLPVEEKCWHAVVTSTHCLFRVGDFEGFSVAIDDVNFMLDLKLRELQGMDDAAESESGLLPRRIVFHQFSDGEVNVSHWQTQYPDIEFVIEKPKEALLSFMRKQTQLSIVCNLLQGEFAPQSLSTVDKSYGKVIATLLLAIVGVSLFGKAGNYWHLKKEMAVLDQAISQQYREIFPTATQVVSPKLRVKRELKSLQENQSGGEFLLLLSQYAASASEQSDIDLSSIKFHNHHLQLGVIVPDFEKLRSLVNAIRKQGLHVEQRQVASQQQHVTAQLIITG